MLFILNRRLFIKLYNIVLGSRYWKNEESIVFALEILFKMKKIDRPLQN